MTQAMTFAKGPSGRGIPSPPRSSSASSRLAIATSVSSSTRVSRLKSISACSNEPSPPPNGPVEEHKLDGAGVLRLKESCKGVGEAATE
eukprot:7255702-Prymnesium_polylepis.1